MKKQDLSQLIGKKFGRLTVLSEGNHRKYPKGWISYMNFICDCGTIKEIELNSVKRGKSTSCGCYNREIASKNFTTHGFSMISKTEKHPDYCIWSKMKARCLNKSDKSYPHYGGRGIKVSDRWLRFEGFLEDMGWRPSKKYSIERVNYNGDYCKENCKWILKSQQSKNKRDVPMIEYNDKLYCLADWCRVLNLPYTTMRHRVNVLKMPFSEAIKYPQHTKCKRFL